MPEKSTTSSQEVAVVTTGGTIGSVLSDSVREVNNSQNEITDRIAKYCKNLGVDIEVFPAVNMLSENMEPVDWADVGKRIHKCIEKGYDSIMVTHGTDTMVYSTNAFRNSINDITSRVIFTGSFYGPDEPENDVEIALRSSLEACIDTSLSNDVYISFRSPESDERALLHRAVDTRPMNMDDMGFRSLFNSVVGEYTQTKGWSWTNNDSPTQNANVFGLGGVPSRKEYSEATGNVQLTKAVPGQFLLNADKEQLPDVLVVSLYHSGTASLSTHINSLRNFIRENKDETEVLLVGMSNRVVSPPYDSTAKLIEEGARLIQDVQPHVIYTAMYVGLAHGMQVNEIIAKSPGSLVDYSDISNGSINNIASNK